MSNDLEGSEIVQIVKNKSEIQILKERFDRHLEEMRAANETINRKIDNKITAKIDDLTKMMHNVEINQLQEQKATMMTVFRMILLNGGIGSLAGAIASLIVNLANK